MAATEIAWARKVIVESNRADTGSGDLANSQHTRSYDRDPDIDGIRAG
jgi:hypothetical protein